MKINKNIHALLFCTVLMIAGAGNTASAGGNLGIISNGSVELFSDKVKPGGFFDTWDFTLIDNNLWVEAAVYDVATASLLDIRLFSWELFDSGDTLLFSGGDGAKFGGHLNPDTYTITVAGLANGKLGGAYAGVVSAVPETSTWVMMLMGIAMVGFVVSRSRA